MSARREASATSGRIAIFGGTFNPIHLGHLRAAEQVVELLGLERILFVPSGDPPHKQGGCLAPAKLRLEWVERAIAGNERFAVDALEVEREGPSYSLETVRALGARCAPEPPIFVVGCDALREMATWREPEAILREAHLAVMARRGAGVGGALPGSFPPTLAASYAFDGDGRGGRHRETGTFVRWLPIVPLDVSATDVRRRLSSGRSIRYLVPESIHAAVLESGCWMEPESA